MDGSSASPVQTLREHASRLEAAVSVSLAKPKPKAVHALRSETRRIEAQLELLATLHDLPAYRAAADKLLRRLKKLRSAAGKVRDCDVLSKLLKDGDAHLDATPEASKSIGQDGKRLRKVIDRDRDRYEKQLLSTVKRQQAKVVANLEALLDALKPREDLQASTATLLAQVNDRFAKVLNTDGSGEEHLHELRKTAKRSRYQCESLPGPEAAAMARDFEGLQDAGGEWHDLLELATRAHQEFGPEHSLSRVLEHRRDQHLDRYSQLLDEFRAHHPAPARKPAASTRAKKVAIKSKAQSKSKGRARKSAHRGRTR